MNERSEEMRNGNQLQIMELEHKSLATYQIRKMKWTYWIGLSYLILFHSTT